MLFPPFFNLQNQVARRDPLDLQQLQSPWQQLLPFVDPLPMLQDFYLAQKQHSIKMLQVQGWAWFCFRKTTAAVTAVREQKPRPQLLSEQSLLV
ncbi:hypothetical protein TB2_044839 [Malus domestica]